MEAAKEAIHHAAGYTKFTTDTSRLFELEADKRHPSAWSDEAVADKFQSMFSDAERGWISASSSARNRRRYFVRFPRGDVLRLAVKFGESLKLNEELFDFIRQEKPARRSILEPSIDEAETLTTPQELLPALVERPRAPGAACSAEPGIQETPGVSGGHADLSRNRRGPHRLCTPQDVAGAGPRVARISAAVRWMSSRIASASWPRWLGILTAL